MGNTPEIRRKHEEYILNNLDISDVTHFYSSEFYGEHMSVALHAIDRRVDVDRTHIPISATAIRADPYRHRAYLEPLVYRDLVTNVVLLGAPSTGKTTLAAALAKLYKTRWMPEYGREYWETHQIERRLSLQQLTEIAEGHLIREEQLLQAANRYLFVDTNAITTFVFSRYYHNDADSRLRQLATTAATRYDLVFVCDTDIPYDDTWDRSGDGNRQMFQSVFWLTCMNARFPTS